MTEAVSEVGTSTTIWEGDRATFAKAFIAAQSKMVAIRKEKENAAFKSKYADLAEVIEAVVPALNGAGIGVLQFPAFDGTWVEITSTLLHESGASVTNILRMRPSKTDPQGVGSATTYGRRYGLLSITGTAPEDDDGNAASGGNGTTSKESSKQQQKAAPPPAQTSSLSERAKSVEAALRAATTLDKLRRANALASGVYAALDTSDPERLVELQALFLRLEDAFVTEMEREPA